MSTFGAPTRTVQDVFTQVKRKFGDESGVQLEDSDLVMWINDAAQVIVTENKILKTRATTPLVNGQADYTFTTLTDPIHSIDSLLVNGARVPNMSVAQAEETISTSDPLGEETGFPAFWYEYAGTVTFWPTPNVDGTITLRYTARPGQVALPADTLATPDDYFMDVVNYVLKQAYEMDENESMMQTKGNEFEASLIKRGEAERTGQNMTYETITVFSLED
jgi:hypothetical protein